MYVWRNTGVCSPNHYCRGRARFMKYSDCVSVVVIQPTVRERHIILSSVSCPSLPYFSTLFHKWYDFLGKSYWTSDMCFEFLCKFRRNISPPNKNSAKYYHKYPYILVWCTRYSCQIVIKHEFLDILEKYSNLKFHENPSSMSRVFPFGQKDGLTVAFRNFAKAHKNGNSLY